jgi:hypothetical protein
VTTLTVNPSSSSSGMLSRIPRYMSCEGFGEVVGLGIEILWP